MPNRITKQIDLYYFCAVNCSTINTSLRDQCLISSIYDLVFFKQNLAISFSNAIRRTISQCDKVLNEGTSQVNQTICGRLVFELGAFKKS